jgi:peptide/nickel transport system substrate-binding protein
MRKLAMAAAAVAVALVVLSPAAAGSAVKPTLTIAYAGACSGMSPLGHTANTYEMQLAYEPLIRMSSDGSLHPGLATAWKIKPGNKMITLTMRTGARFSDGAAVTAQAVKTWLDFRVAHPTGLDLELGPVRSVEALGSSVVRVTLKSPNSNLLRALASYYWDDFTFVPSPKAVADAKAHSQNASWAWRTFGAGPYVLDPSQTVTNDHCTFLPNKYYLDKSRVRWGRVITKNITDANTMLAAMRAGQVDIGNGVAATASAAAANGFKVVHGQTRDPDIIFYDRAGKHVPALGDVRVRRALNYAIDRKTIARSLYGPGAIPTSEPETDVIYPSLVNYYPYDPAKAKALLAAAGYPNGFTFTMLCFGAFAGSFSNENLANAVKQDLAAIGVTVVVDAPATGSDFGKLLFDPSMDSFAWSVGPDPPLYGYSFELKPDAVFNPDHVDDPVLDKLWLKGQRLLGKPAAAVWRQFVTREVTQADWLPIVRPPDYWYASKRVGGFVSTTSPSALLDVNAWYPTGK